MPKVTGIQATLLLIEATRCALLAPGRRMVQRGEMLISHMYGSSLVGQSGCAMGFAVSGVTPKCLSAPWCNEPLMPASSQRDDHDAVFLALFFAPKLRSSSTIRWAGSDWASRRGKRLISKAASRPAVASSACSSFAGRTRGGGGSSPISARVGVGVSAQCEPIVIGRTEYSGHSISWSASSETTSTTRAKSRFSSPETTVFAATARFSPRTPRTKSKATVATTPRREWGRAAWTTASAALVAAICASASASAAPLSIVEFDILARRCAPHVAVETLAAVARTESGFDALTIHDNADGRDHHPESIEAAIALGTELAVVRKHSIDLGLMQVNSANLPALRLDLRTAFDACLNLGAADQVLVASYRAPAQPAADQAALNAALSRYNTGDPIRGIANGYVDKVRAAAAVVVPAIELGRRADNLPTASASITAVPLPPPPPSWDVYGQALAARGTSIVFGQGGRSAMQTDLPGPKPATTELATSAR